MTLIIYLLLLVTLGALIPVKFYLLKTWPFATVALTVFIWLMSNPPSESGISIGVMALLAAMAFPLALVFTLIRSAITKK